MKQPLLTDLNGSNLKAAELPGAVTPTSRTGNPTKLTGKQTYRSGKVMIRLNQPIKKEGHNVRTI
jgi:hypothetical protein